MVLQSRCWSLLLKATAVYAFAILISMLPRHASDLPPGGAEHIRGDGAQLDVGRLQDFLDPIGIPGTVLDQLLPEAGQLAEFAEGRRRHQTRPEQAMLQQPRPLAILDAGLPPGTVFTCWTLTRRSSKRPSRVW